MVVRGGQGQDRQRANRCGDCRRKRRLRRSQERRAHVEGMVAKYGLAEAARRLRCTMEALEWMRARRADD
jgi:hypothetical protein